MIAVGFAGLLKALAFSNDSVIFTIGSLGEVLIYALLIHLLLSFPVGTAGQPARPCPRRDRVLQHDGGSTGRVRTQRSASRAAPRCPANPLLIDHSDAAAGVISAAQLDIAIAVLGAVVAILYRRWRDSSHESATGPSPRSSPSAASPSCC